MTRSATRRARRYTCGTKTVANCGAQRCCRSARRLGPIPLDTAKATAVLNTRHTGSRSVSCSSCRLEDPIKISRLTFENHSGRPRRLSVTAYEWVLGVSRSTSAPFVVTEVDPATGVMFARNAWNGEFSDRVAFADLGGARAWTGDGVSWPQRHPRPSHVARTRGPTRGGSVPASTPAPPCRQRLTCGPCGDCLFPWRGGNHGTGGVNHALPRG